MTQGAFWPEAVIRPIMGNHGKKAVSAGKLWEDVIVFCAERRGLQVERQTRTGWENSMGEKIRVDAILYGLAGYREGLVIEMKYQNSSGSIHHKIGFLAQEIPKCYKLPTIIVWGGQADEIRRATEYAKRLVNGAVFVGVYTFDEYFAWLEKQEPHKD